MTSAQKIFEKLIVNTDDAELSQMFGKPCGKLNKKAFIAFFEDEIVFKLGRENIEEWRLNLSDSKNFDPSGKNRPMKDWLQVSKKHKKHFKKLLELSLGFCFG